MKSVVPAILFGAITALAGFQEPRAELSGVVRDKSGGVMPGVVVVIAAPTHREPIFQVTRPDGAYRFTSLPAGSYTLSFRSWGCLEVARDGVVVEDAKHVEVNATLVPAAMRAEASTRTGSPVTPASI